MRNILTPLAARRVYIKNAHRRDETISLQHIVMKHSILILIISVVFHSLLGVESASTATMSGRKRRTAVISMPSNSAIRFTNEIIVPVLAMINQTNTYLWFDFQVYMGMPTASQLNLLYQSLPQLGRDNKDGKEGRTSDDAEDVENFVEEQRANFERRTVYQYIEGFFSK